MDEVARERAQAAHQRLDGINGQIARLADEQAKTREGIYDAIGKLWDEHAKVAQSVARMDGRFGTAMKVAGAIGVAMLALLGSLLAYTVTHSHQAAPRNATERVEKPTGSRGVGERLASRQRGAHGRLDGP